MGKEGFKGLKVWQKAKSMAVSIYKITGEGRFKGDFSLRDQIRRAAVSIPSNIAEGDELGTDKQAIRHFHIAKGSAAEVLTQAVIAFEIGYLNEKIFYEIESRCSEIAKMLTSLIKTRQPKPDA